MIHLLGLTPERLQELELIRPEQVIRIAQDALKRLDTRLMDHGDRVAFIVREMMEQDGGYSQERINLVCQLALFHDIGAYKTEEIERMLIFESTEAMEHSLYGYLFLSYFTPMGEAALGVLYHHLNFCDGGSLSPTVLRNAQLIHLADRVDILNLSGNVDLERLRKSAGRVFDPELMELFLTAQRERGILERLNDGRYRQSVELLAAQICPDVGTAIDYLSMLVYLIDFKSEATVNHTINTVAYAVILSRLMGLPEIEQYRIYLGATLHDIGKIAIPHEILENPGKLTYDEMVIMKTHVVITDEILQGAISDHIRLIAARHHEKPDGSGYPQGLVSAQLTVSERILAVADVMSALMGRRSYKEAMDGPSAASIIARMADTGKLDREVCQAALEHFDEILEVGRLHCAPVLESYEKLSAHYRELLEQTAGTLQNT